MSCEYISCPIGHCSSHGAKPRRAVERMRRARARAGKGTDPNCPGTGFHNEETLIYDRSSHRERFSADGNRDHPWEALSDRCFEKKRGKRVRNLNGVRVQRDGARRVCGGWRTKQKKGRKGKRKQSEDAPSQCQIIDR